MKSPDLWQVVIDPRDGDVEQIEAAVREMIEEGGGIEISRRTTLRLYLASLLHLFGVHHWVGYRTFDPGSGRIIVWSNRWVCSLCPRGRIE